MSPKELKDMLKGLSSKKFIREKVRPLIAALGEDKLLVGSLNGLQSKLNRAWFHRYNELNADSDGKAEDEEFVPEAFKLNPKLPDKECTTQNVCTGFYRYALSRVESPFQLEESCRIQRQR
jgi:hypothetical protein